MLHACAVRFDVTENLKNFLVFGVKALFSSEIFSNFDTIAFSFLFDKHYLIID